MAGHRADDRSAGARPGSAGRGWLMLRFFGRKELDADERGDLPLVEHFLLKRGEAEFRILYRRHAPVMRRVSHRLVGSLGLAADDIVQEAWLRAVRGLATFERRSSFRSWLIGF